MVRQGQKIRNTSTHTVNLIRYVENKLNKEILKAKRDDTKKKRQREKNEMMKEKENQILDIKCKENPLGHFNELYDVFPLK